MWRICKQTHTQAQLIFYKDAKVIQSEKWSFQQMMLEQLDVYGKSEPPPRLQAISKSLLKWVTNQIQTYNFKTGQNRRKSISAVLEEVESS